MRLINVRIKVVPLIEPNAEGEWITVRMLPNSEPAQLLLNARSWLQVAPLLRDLTPESTAAVAYELPDREEMKCTD